MNEDLLRRWANDDLSEAEKRDVYRWMVRCTDPDLPGVLAGLMRERREREADRALASSGAFWGGLVDRWNRWLADGGATWTQPGLGPVPAGVDDQRGPQVWVEESADGATRVELDVEPGLEVAILLTDDRPSVSLVDVGPGGRRSVDVGPAGARPTAWVFVGPALERRADARSMLQALLDQDGIDRAALRWDQPSA